MFVKFQFVSVIFVLEKKIKKNEKNVRIIKSSYWNFSLLPLVIIYRFFDKMFFTKKIRSGYISRVNSTLNSFMIQVLNIENKLLKYINYPFGISTFCVVTKN